MLREAAQELKASSPLDLVKNTLPTPPPTSQTTRSRRLQRRYQPRSTGLNYSCWGLRSSGVDERFAGQLGCEERQNIVGIQGRGGTLTTGMVRASTAQDLPEGEPPSHPCPSRQNTPSPCQALKLNLITRPRRRVRCRWTAASIRVSPVEAFICRLSFVVLRSLVRLYRGWAAKGGVVSALDGMAVEEEREKEREVAPRLRTCGKHFLKLKKFLTTHTSGPDCVLELE